MNTTPAAISSVKSGLPPIKPEQPADAVAVEALVGRAFGPGRFAKTAERLREGRTPRLDLSFVCRAGGELIGCVRQWDIRIGGRPMIFLGPFAVDPAWRSRGLGGALIERAAAAAKAAGAPAILLVGDEPYFGPHGFSIARPCRFLMPGPVDPRRVMLRPFRAEADTLEGAVTAG
jgi:predicted N-acetyltransferase YhbS